MVIPRLLKYSAFGPEEIEIVATAYEHTLSALDLPKGDSLVTEIVAKKIIEICANGRSRSGAHKRPSHRGAWIS